MQLWGMTRLLGAIVAHMALTMVSAWKVSGARGSAVIVALVSCMHATLCDEQYQELVELESDAVNSVDFCKRVNKVTGEV